MKPILMGVIIGALVAFSIIVWRIRAKTREAEAFHAFYRASEILMSAEEILIYLILPAYGIMWFIRAIFWSIRQLKKSKEN